MEAIIKKMEPIVIHKSKYTIAELIFSPEDGVEVQVTTDIKKLKEDYPFRLPDTVTSYININKIIEVINDNSI